MKRERARARAGQGERAAERAGRRPRRARWPRIVVIDDEDWMIGLLETLIQRQFREVTIVSFQNRDTAWEVLQWAEPDLLITDLNNDNVPGREEDVGMSDWKLLDLLRRRKVRCRVLVVSGCLSLAKRESVAQAFAGPDLKVSFLRKPFTEEFFHKEVRRLVLGGGRCGRRTLGRD